MVMLCNMEEIIAFLVKMTFWPQWPQMTPDMNIWPHNIGRGSQAWCNMYESFGYAM